MIETATSDCSVALIEGGAVIAHDSAIVGRGHAEQLMPMIARLPGGGRADEIWVDCGPGSFTGVRVGVAAARGLGFGWGVPVHGFSSMALIAATWFAGHADRQVIVVIEGGHGEVFAQPFAANPLRSTAPLESVTPDAVRVTTACLIGNAASKVAVLTGSASLGDCAPDAANAVHLAGATLIPSPIYGRDADARPITA